MKPKIKFRLSIILFSFACFFSAHLFPTNARASETDALEITRELFERHNPYGTLISPNLISPDSKEIDGWLHSGDSAIWTGHWLAAESFRWAVLKDEESLNNVKKILKGIEGLVDVTGTDLLARAYYPEGVPDIEASKPFEERHGYYPGLIDGKKYIWLGNTTRDQYAGVFLGLGTAYDFVDDPEVKARCAALITRMVKFLLKNHWIIRDPTGKKKNLFLGRPEQKLSILQLATHVNAKEFKGKYKFYRFLVGQLMGAVIWGETTALHSSYFKFNLAHGYLFNLIRLEKSKYWKWIYISWFKKYRQRLANHDNAHFNMVERALLGPDEIRDPKTLGYLEDWLLRPKTNIPVDNTEKYPACGENISCIPIRVADRISDSFVWQRSPFKLKQGGDGVQEIPGVDYILPYWMARYYGLYDKKP